MRPRNELPRLAILFLPIFCATFVLAQQGQSAAQANRPPNAQATQTQAPSASVHREGTDNILVDASGIPLEDQSGKKLAI